MTRYSQSIRHCVESAALSSSGEVPEWSNGLDSTKRASVLDARSAPRRGENRLEAI